MTFKPPKTAWNGDQLGYDELILNPNDDRECTYCLTQPQAKALLALIDRYRFTTRWYSEEEPVDRLDIEHFVNDCQRRLMMACCGDEIPIQFRFDITGDLEASEDGGTTWTPAPERDPRVYSTEFPPPTGDQADKCSAADSGVNAIVSEIFDELAGDMSKATLDQLLRTWVQTYIDTSNPLQALLAVVINLIFGLGITLLIAALTSDVWDAFRCCLYNHMNDDFSFDHDGWLGLRECIGEDISGIAGIFLEHLVFLLGPVGCTNICRAGLGAASPDCDDCIEPSCSTIWHTSEPPEQYGALTVDPETGDITVVAGLNGSTYTVIMFTGDGSDNMLCCNMQDRELVSGTAPSGAFWYPCGSDTGASGIPGFECVYDLQLFGSAPFTILFHPIDC